jgi:serine phosphatase RsbU (regulator of sigma subunit)
VDPAVIAREPTHAEGRLRRLERLQDVCRMVSGTVDLAQVLPFICDAVHDVLGYGRVVLYRIDARTQRIVGPLAISDETGRGGDGARGRRGEGETGRGGDPATAASEARPSLILPVPPSPSPPPGVAPLLSPSPSVWSLELRRGASAVVDVALGHLPYWLCGEAPCDSLDGAWARFQLGCPMAVVPLRGRGQVVGLMVVANPRTGLRLSHAAIEDLLPFAEQAGQAIAATSFAAESQRRVGFLSALLQISTSLTTHSELTELLQGACDKLLEVSELQIAAVYRVEGPPDRQMLRLHTSAGMRPELPEFSAPFRVGEHLAGRAALERLVIVNRNIQHDESPAAAMARRIGLQTVICAPLLLREELLGVLAAGTVHDMELTGEEMDLVSSVAHQLSAAIANLRLLEETRSRMEEHRRRRDEMTVLYGISRAMVATIDLEQRLRVIAEGLAEVTRTTRCAIFRRDRDGLIPWISYGDTAEEKRRFHGLDIDPADATRLMRAVSARKPPVVMRTVEREPFARMPWLRAWGVRSALWLPLAFQNRMTGLAVVYQPGEEQPFHADQVELAAAVANQAAIAIRVSQAYEHERNIAETLQRSFMPTVGARLKNFDVGQTYHPALQEAQVGGDFYDLFPLPDGQIALLMADVSGKGLPAAIQTAMVKYMLRAYAVEEPTPASVLARLNRGVCAFIDPELFVTAFYALLCPDTGQLQYGNAGHDSPILALKEHGYCTSLDVTGPPLGLDPTVTYFTRNLCLAPGDLLLLFTDGVTNAAHGGELFGRERLEHLVAELAPGKPNRIVSQIYRTVRAFAAGNLQDDCALLAIKAKEDVANRS